MIAGLLLKMNFAQDRFLADSVEKLQLASTLHNVIII